MTAAVFEDAFNLLCGKLIGEGIHRKVFACRLRPELVVKVEENEGFDRYFANLQESKFWSDNQYHEPVAKWLAPVEYLSPDCRILLQRRCDPVPESYELPPMLPHFLTDHKRENFGILDGRFVCVDYAMTLQHPNKQLRKASW